MSLLRQGKGLAATQAAAAVRSLMGSAAGPAPHSVLHALPSHSSRGMSTAAASLWAPAESQPRSVTAAIGAATGFVSEWTQRISIWLAAPKSKITAHRRGQKRQHQKLKWVPVMSRCPKCERVMRQREVVSRCPVPDCPCGVSRPAAAKLQQASAQQEGTSQAIGS